MRHLTLGKLKEGGRRLAVQTLISGTVMAGLNLAAQNDFGAITVHWLTGSEVQASSVIKVMPDAPSAVALERTEQRNVPQTFASVTASGKTNRLPGLRSEARRVATDALSAIKASPAVARQVVLFDQCMPGCESQDPLLPVRQMALTTSPATTLPSADRNPAIALPKSLAVAEQNDTERYEAAPKADAGRLQTMSGRVVAAGQAGLRSFTSGLTSISIW